MQYYIKTINSNKICPVLGPHEGACHIDRDHMAALSTKQQEFYKDLEEDILQNGMNDPIVCHIGIIPANFTRRPACWIPDGWNLDVDPVCWALGGSRLWVAQKHNMQIKVVLTDANGVTKGKSLTPEAIIEKYPYLRFNRDYGIIPSK